MKKFLLPFLLLFCAGMVIFPQESFAAASHGLQIWWQRIVPALLPFFISSELLIRMGAAELLGKLLRPIMRPIFNLPGEAALALGLGYTAGFPTGASVTASLRQNGLCTQKEGERLISFTNNASPLFIMVAVAAGILGQPELGILLAAVHYGSNLLIGFGLGLLSRIHRESNNLPLEEKGILQQMHQNQSIGSLLKEAGLKAFQNLLLIGALMAFFSVLTQLLTCCGLFHILKTENQQALAAGFWEISLGVDAAAGTAYALSTKAALISFIMAWGGLSIQAQVAAMVSQTDIRLYPYVGSRLAQGILAYIATYFLCQQKVITTASQLFAPAFQIIPAPYGWLLCGFSISLLCLQKILKKSILIK